MAAFLLDSDEFWTNRLFQGNTRGASSENKQHFCGQTFKFKLLQITTCFAFTCPYYSDSQECKRGTSMNFFLWAVIWSLILFHAPPVYSSLGKSFYAWNRLSKISPVTQTYPSELIPAHRTPARARKHREVSGKSLWRIFAVSYLVFLLCCRSKSQPSNTNRQTAGGDSGQVKQKQNMHVMILRMHMHTNEKNTVMQTQISAFMATNSSFKSIQHEVFANTLHSHRVSQSWLRANKHTGWSVRVTSDRVLWMKP